MRLPAGSVDRLRGPETLQGERASVCSSRDVGTHSPRAGAVHPRAVEKRPDERRPSILFPEVPPGRDDLFLRSCRPAREVGRAAGPDERGERLADRTEAVLDGQLDQVGFRAASQPRTQRVNASSRTVSASAASNTWKSGSIPASRRGVEAVPRNTRGRCRPAPLRARAGPPASARPRRPAPHPAMTLVSNSLPQLACGLLGERQGHQGRSGLAVPAVVASPSRRRGSARSARSSCRSPPRRSSATLAPATASGRLCWSVRRGAFPAPVIALMVSRPAAL